MYLSDNLLLPLALEVWRQMFLDGQMKALSYRLHTSLVTAVYLLAVILNATGLANSWQYVESS